MYRVITSVPTFFAHALQVTKCTHLIGWRLALTARGIFPSRCKKIFCEDFCYKKILTAVLLARPDIGCTNLNTAYRPTGVGFSIKAAFYELKETIRRIYYMASITSGEMADCDWLRSTFSGPLFSRIGSAVHCVKTNAYILRQNSKTN
jgi:hypothetical protein